VKSIEIGHEQHTRFHFARAALRKMGFEGFDQRAPSQRRWRGRRSGSDREHIDGGCRRHKPDDPRGVALRIDIQACAVKHERTVLVALRRDAERNAEGRLAIARIGAQLIMDPRAIFFRKARGEGFERTLEVTPNPDQGLTFR